MDFNDQTPMTEFGVHERNFKCPQPFEDKHVCNENEAKVLNQILVENVRNNVRAPLAKLIEKGEDDAALAKFVDEYIQKYDFHVTRSGSSRTPLERAMLEIALPIVKNAYQARGEKLSEVGHSVLIEKALALCEKNPKIRENAEKVLELQNIEL